MSKLNKTNMAYFMKLLLKAMKISQKNNIEISKKKLLLISS